MAFRESNWDSNYICLTTDTKITANIPEGSTLTVLDDTAKTVDHYELFHDGAWYKIQ